jgi:tetratricopeptide (TPR) repeat protein
MDDIFTIQSNVAEAVANELQSTLNPNQSQKLKEKPTANLEAYDLFLKGKHAFNQWGVEGYRTASEYFKRALEKDPEFKLAYSYLASSYSARMSWNGDLSPAEALENINRYLGEAWKRGATDNDYLTKAFVEFFINKDFAVADDLLLKAIELGPNNSTVYFTRSYLQCMLGNYDEAMKLIKAGRVIEPNSVAYYNYYGICLYLQERYDEALSAFEEALKLFPQVLRLYDHLGRVHLTMGNHEEAIAIMHAGLRFGRVRPPSMLAYLAMAHHYLGQESLTTELLQELTRRSEKNEKGTNIYVVHVYLAMGQLEEAAKWIAKAQRTNDIDLIWRDVDPLLVRLNELSTLTPKEPDFEAAEKFIIGKQEAELPKQLHYHNIDHILDVLNAAIKIAKEEQISSEETHLLRIAALYHDAGFITSASEHESHGCTIARDTLPAFGLNTEQIEIVCGMIMATKIPQTPQTPLERIICDADLDYLGREDFYDVGSHLYEEMKGYGFVESEREWNLIQKTFLESHRYHTKFARQNREKKKQQHLKEIIAKFRR